MTTQCYTPGEVSRLLKIPKTTLARWAREGKLPKEMGAIIVRSEGRTYVRYPKKNIDALIGGTAA